MFTQVAISLKLPNHVKIRYVPCLLYRCFFTLSTSSGLVFTQVAITWELPNHVKIRLEPSFLHTCFLTLRTGSGLVFKKSVLSQVFLHRSFFILSTGSGLVLTQVAIAWELPNHVKIHLEPCILYTCFFSFLLK